LPCLAAAAHPVRAHALAYVAHTFAATAPTAAIRGGRGVSASVAATRFMFDSAMNTE
jgi:hypothetical protein